MKLRANAGMKVLVTGATGMLGREVMRELLGNWYDCKGVSSAECNLLDFKATDELVRKQAPDIVVHLAADVGGVLYSSTHQASQLMKNTRMADSIVMASAKNHVGLFVGIGSVCEYPDDAPQPLTEDDVDNGLPADTNFGYGMAKRYLRHLEAAAYEQFGMQYIHLMPSNMYGRHDKCDELHAHVIPAMFRKFIDAKKRKEDTVVFGGYSTNTRHFLHVKDCARAIRMAIVHGHSDIPINIPGYEEIALSALADKIAGIVGWSGKSIVFDGKKAGQKRRLVNGELARQLLGFETEISLDEGLSDFYAWLQEEYEWAR